MPVSTRAVESGAGWALWSTSTLGGSWSPEEDQKAKGPALRTSQRGRTATPRVYLELQGPSTRCTSPGRPLLGSWTAQPSPWGCRAA